MLELGEPLQYGWCPYKKGDIWRQTDTHTHLNMKAAIEVMHL